MKSFRKEFREIFYKKHGKEVFQELVKQIEQEYNGKCDTKYIDIIFSIAFLTYVGISDTKRLALLVGISRDKDINVENLLKLHKKSISKIQEYIKIQTNKK